MMLFLPRGTRGFRGQSALLAAALISFSASIAASAQAAAPAQAPGTVIYSRSTDLRGQTTTTNGPAATVEGRMVNAPIASDAERSAITFTDFDLDVHLRTAEQNLAVRAVMTVRNDGKTPLRHIPLQLSSSLNWESIRLNGSEVPFAVATLNSDADHTGQLHEATVTLSQPLAPGATAQLDTMYSGTIRQTAQRLLAIGTPAEVANHSDWDSIGLDFTGLRGFGDVVWYPASSIPVMLGEGARLFDEMGEHKLRMSGAHFRMRLTIEFPSGHAPTVAVINGHPVALTVRGGVGELPGIATAGMPETILGFDAPSLFVAVREARMATNTTIWTMAADELAVPSWTAAVSAVTPFLQGWLGETPRSELTVLDLPDPADAPFEAGALLAAAIRPAASEQLDGMMAHALTHAWMESPRAWLSEGVAHFMGTLWLEKEAGRARALESLEAMRPALALAEPASPGIAPGQSLALATSPIYYRTKATYVFWMLRDLAGDVSLSAALRAYNPAADQSKGYGRETAGPGEFEKLIERPPTRRNLAWFFNDWVDTDKGLPDISIAKVFSEAAQGGMTLVGVTLNNAGYAAAEIPVTVSTPATSVTRRIVVPARGSLMQRILIQGNPTQVQANDGTVPEVEASVHVMKIEPPAANPASLPGVPE